MKAGALSSAPAPSPLSACRACVRLLGGARGLVPRSNRSPPQKTPVQNPGNRLLSGLETGLRTIAGGAWSGTDRIFRTQPETFMRRSVAVRQGHGQRRMLVARALIVAAMAGMRHHRPGSDQGAISEAGFHKITWFQQLVKLVILVKYYLVLSQTKDVFQHDFGLIRIIVVWLRSCPGVQAYGSL